MISELTPDQHYSRIKVMIKIGVRVTLQTRAVASTGASTVLVTPDSENLRQVRTITHITLLR